MHEPFVPVLVIAVPIAVIFGVAKSAAWVLRPIDEAAKNRSYPPQFSLADFLCLFVLLQLIMALVHSVFGEALDSLYGGYQGIILLDVLGCLAFGLYWWASVGVLSRAGIRKGSHRSLFIVAVIPLTFAGSAAIPFLPLFAFGALFDGRIRIAFLLLATELVAIAIVYSLGRLTRWMLARGVNSDGTDSLD